MQELDRQLETLEALHVFVHETLCASENLLQDQFQTQRLPLKSKGRLCAIEYSLRGPRSIRLAAIWAADQNVVYFYNAAGQRYLKVKLTKRIDATELSQVA